MSEVRRGTRFGADKWRPVERGRCSRHAGYQSLFGLTITMYFDDHEPAHFHVRHAEGEAKIGIDTLEVIDSNLGRRQLRLALAWAELHQEELMENGQRARRGETLNPIEPLRCSDSLQR